MIEEIKEDNNCIIRAFENNPIAILQEDINNKKVYYFKASDIGKALNLSNIRQSIQNYDDGDEQVVRKAYDLRGCEQDTTFLTSQGVYRLLYNSKKEIAKKFRKWAGNILDDIIFNESIELKKQLKEKEILLKESSKLLLEKNTQHILQLKLNKHQILIDKFKNKKCVYAANIYDNYIKLGSTENLEDTCMRHITTYGKCIYLDVFECENFRDVERNILIDEKINKNLYRKKINNHVSREVVELSDTFIYEDILEIIKKYVNQLDLYISPEIIELKRINFFKYLISEKNYTLDDIKELSNIQFYDNLSDKKHNDNDVNNNNKIIKNIEENTEINLKSRRLNLGKKINQIDPVNLTILKTYYSLTNLINENPTFSKTQINRAINNNKVYKNFRWNYDECEIKQTNITKTSTQVEPILKLNNDKTKILESYSTKKEIRKILNLPEKKFDKIIKNKELYNNYYYIKKSECPNDLLQTNEIQIKEYIPKCSKKIKQINPISKHEVIFNSLTEACTMYGINSRTITENIKNKTVYCGSLWEYV